MKKFVRQLGYVAVASAMCASVSHAEITVIRKEQPKPVEVESASNSDNATNTSTQDVVSTAPVVGQQMPVVQNANYVVPNGQANTALQRVAYTPNNQFRMKTPPAYMGCFYQSSRKYGVPVDLLLAIAQTESSFSPSISGSLGKGTDHGLMQINQYWIPRLKRQFNISMSELYEPCTNIEVASWILAHNYVQYKNWSDAVGAYNAVTRWKQLIYIRKVSANLDRLHAGQL